MFPIQFQNTEMIMKKKLANQLRFLLHLTVFFRVCLRQSGCIRPIAHLHTRGKTNNSTILPLRLSDNNYAFTNKEKAECLNDFFYSISSIDDSDNDLGNFENRTDSCVFVEEVVHLRGLSVNSQLSIS